MVVDRFMTVVDLVHAAVVVLQGCQRVVEDWQKILQVRSLVLSPQEDMQSWLKYSSLCRRSGRLALSHKTLVMLLGNDPSKQPDQLLPTTYPQVTFAYMKHMWREGQKVRLFRNTAHHAVPSPGNENTPLTTWCRLLVTRIPRSVDV